MENGNDRKVSGVLGDSLHDNVSNTALPTSELVRERRSRVMCS